jgi:hypothetical protein
MKVGHQAFGIGWPVPHVRFVKRFEEAHAMRTRETCFASGCHDTRAAKTTCGTCHRRLKYVRPKTHTPAWTKIHGDAAVASPMGCATCHRDAPGPAGATTNPEGKGTLLSELLGSRSCSDCHRQQRIHVGRDGENGGEL